jgi:RNA polymerase sigma factor (TIGR02999 family)
MSPRPPRNLQQASPQGAQQLIISRERGGGRRSGPPATSCACAKFAARVILVAFSFSSLVEAAEHGDGPAAERLFAQLYSELKHLAKRELARQAMPVTLSATTLLHEAYLEMASRDGPSFPDQARFMGYAARVMRGLIIDYARSRHAQKRGGQFQITSLRTGVGENIPDDHELSRLSDALDELAKVDASLAEIVDLKFFCGFSFPEIAAMRGACERTVQRQWEKARIYLHHSVRTRLG